MIFVPVLIALTVIVTASVFIIVSVQRTFTRSATLRREHREGGPFANVYYSVSEPAWPFPAPLPSLRKGAERPARVATGRAKPAVQDTAEAA